MSTDANAKAVERYIATFPTEVQSVLRRIRRIVKEAVPGAQEKLSYAIPTYVLNGKTLLHFAAFRQHIGWYPPVRVPKLQRELKAYQGPKGNLKFPLNRPLPYPLIRKIVKSQVREIAGGGKSERIAVENVNHPGSTRLVDASIYAATRRAYLRVLPKRLPGLTLAQIQERLLPHLPAELIPNGAKAGWWAKTVQLNLEAKGLVVREQTKPLRLHKVLGFAALR